MKLPEVTIRLPQWVPSFLQSINTVFPSREERMRFVIALSKQNIVHETGGPFAAAIFDDAGKLLAPGVNMVTSANCSILHAEMVAIALAQKILGCYDISGGGRFRYSLYASTEPCAMCFGAVPWSGIQLLVCGARGEDAGSVGFDEGPKLKNWPSALNERHIEVIRDVLRKEAAAVLTSYADTGGIIYNPG